MNDYKELIEMLRSRSKSIIHEDAELVGIPEENIWDADANALVDAADAIEQLMKERDEQNNYIAELHEEAANLVIALDSERNSADEWQHDYFELLTKLHQLEKERDAARLLFENSKSWKCPACAHNRAPNSRTFADCDLDGECKNTDKLPTCFEWRGVQEDNT